MEIDAAKLKQGLMDGSIKLNEVTHVIESGSLSHTVPYEIKHGWNPTLATQCDYQWSGFFTQLFETLQSLNKSEEEEAKILDSIQAGDIHWRWFNKTFCYKEDEYEWFFMVAEGEVQGACLIYHPKESKLEKGNIFYIEYLASAPWNRGSLINEKAFNGVGTILLKCAINYAINTLNLKPGFSLHSLHSAEGYYIKRA